MSLRFSVSGNDSVPSIHQTIDWTHDWTHEDPLRRPIYASLISKCLLIFPNQPAKQQYGMPWHNVNMAPPIGKSLDFMGHVIK